MSFAAFFLHHDGTVLGRYGSRASKQDGAENLISLAGLRESLAGALALHQKYPDNKAALAGKQSVPTDFKRPEDYPSLSAFKPDLDYAGAVAKSCIHCHQIRDAEREIFRTASKPIPDHIFFPYPLPDILGLSLDPDSRATAAAVAPDSPAAAAGLKPGDEILTFAGQPALSLADLQWALHNAPDSGSLPISLRRDGKIESASLALAEGWRRSSDISWRTSTWSLRRMAFGGMVLTQDPTSPTMSLTAEHVGQYGEHALAKNAGLVKGDRITSFNGIADPLTESQLIRRILTDTKPGASVPVTAVRNGREMKFTIRLP